MHSNEGEKRGLQTRTPPAIHRSRTQTRHTYRRNAELLAEKGVEVDYSTIHVFVKVRSNPRRAVITMLEADAENTSASGVSAVQAPAGTSRIPERADTQRGAIRRLKNAEPTTRRRRKGLASFKPDAPLDRLSEEEAWRLPLQHISSIRRF